MRQAVRLWMFVSILVTFALAGCVKHVQSVRWDKPDVTQQQFLTDRYACIQEAREQRAGGYANPYGAQYGSTAVVNISVFQACMAARGYTRNDANGQFDAPAGGEVYGPLR